MVLLIALNISLSVYQVRCVLCSFVSEVEENAKKHVVKEHQNWKREVDNLTRVKRQPQTIHNNQNWRPELLRNFKELIIGKCSEKVQLAVASNEDIQVCNGSM